jgi:hypothetical protein
MNRKTPLFAALSLLPLVGCGLDAQFPADEAEPPLVAEVKAQPAPGLDCSSARLPEGVDPPAMVEACRQRATGTTASTAKASASAVAKAAAASTCQGVPGPCVISAPRIAWNQADFSKVPFLSDALIQTQFRHSRDIRNMKASNNASFIRRISWLYPDDGCMARAELVADLARQQTNLKPYKLFVLNYGAKWEVATPNAPGGVVTTWWYHVAPIYKSLSTGKVMVFDAALEPSQPLEYSVWLDRFTKSKDTVGVVVADGNAYDPLSPVTGGQARTTTAKTIEQNTFLAAEWDRQIYLRRDPVVVLGEYPPWAAAETDFNYDKKTDILWRNGSAGQTIVWHMDGLYMIANPLIQSDTIVPDADWRLVGSGDFDQDGKADLVWQYLRNGLVRVWYMDGINIRSPLESNLGDFEQVAVNVSGGWSAAGLGDFNYDGHPDLVLHNGGNGQTIVWYMNGTKRTGSAYLQKTSVMSDAKGWKFAGTGDFDHDGKVDVVWRSGSTGRTLVWYLEGVNIRSPSGSNWADVYPQYPVYDTGGWVFAGTGDFNYDGKIDILWFHKDLGLTQYWYLDGVTMTDWMNLPYIVQPDSGWVPAGN